MFWPTDGVGPAQLHSRCYDLNTARVLELCGEADLCTEGVLRSALDAAQAGSPTTLIIDLTRLEFIDADCARQILDAAQHTTLCLAGVHGAAGLVIDLLDPAEDLLRHHSVDDAAARVS